MLKRKFTSVVRKRNLKISSLLMIHCSLSCNLYCSFHYLLIFTYTGKIDVKIDFFVVTSWGVQITSVTVTTTITF